MKGELVGDNKLSVLRTLAVLVVVVGAVVSLGLVLHAGSKNPSILLIALFVIWVLSPFGALLLANLVSKRLPFLTRVTHYILMLVITFGSLAGYSGILDPPGVKPAFKFLIVPLLSWIIIVIAYLIAKKKNKF
jgi:hypothetical protein